MDKIITIQPPGIISFQYSLLIYSQYINPMNIVVNFATIKFRVLYYPLRLSACNV